MAKFGANSVSAIEYDLSKWNGPKGTVPEPTDAGIKTFFKTMKESAGKIGIDPSSIGNNPEEVAGMLENLSEDSMFEIQDDIADAMGELCQDNPSAEQIKALPFRVKQAFLGFIIGEIQSPEESSGGTNNSLRAVRSA